MKTLQGVGLGLALLIFATPALADHRDIAYEVRVTNITKGQTFTPLLVATHNSRVRLFDVREPASKALEILAEAGDTAPMTEK